MTINENNNRKLGTIQVNLLTNGSDLMNGDSNLISVDCPFPALINGTRMFYGCSSLQTIKANFDNLSLGINMFYGCENLNRFECTAPNITDGYNMFRYCSSLSNDSILTDNFTTYIIDGLGMFQGTAITQIPWTFPNLVRSRQMFRDTQISGHLSLNMPNQFPNVSLENFKIYSNNDKAQYPVAQMFYGCAITSIDFDVSSLDEGISMFAFCEQLTTCTGAVFQQGGNYQSMFAESKFNEESALLIFNAAKTANVSALHIGIGFQLTDNHPFVIEHQLVRYVPGYDEQWQTQSGNVVFKCNTSNTQTMAIDDTNHPPTID